MTDPELERLLEVMDPTGELRRNQLAGAVGGTLDAFADYLGDHGAYDALASIHEED